MQQWKLGVTCELLHGFVVFCLGDERRTGSEFQQNASLHTLSDLGVDMFVVIGSPAMSNSYCRSGTAEKYIGAKNASGIQKRELNRFHTPKEP